MAGATVVGIDFRPRLRRARVMLKPRQAANEMHGGVEIGLLHPIKRRHFREARVGVILVADAVTHGIGDLLHRAAPEPIVVQKVGVARGHDTPCPRAMALRAIGRKDRAPSLRRKTVQFFVILQHRQIDGHEALRQIGVRQIHAGDLGGDFTAGGIAQQPRRSTRDHRPCGIEDGIDHAPDDGGVKGPEPPARQGRVQLFDPVPTVACGLGPGGGVDLAIVGHGWAPSWRA